MAGARRALATAAFAYAAACAAMFAAQRSLLSRSARPALPPRGCRARRLQRIAGTRGEVVALNPSGAGGRPDPWGCSTATRGH